MGLRVSQELSSFTYELCHFELFNPPSLFFFLICENNNTCFIGILCKLNEIAHLVQWYI